MTPIAYFESIGALNTRVCGAHCVKVSDEDIAIMAKHGVSASHNPTSNLKLGSGIMPYKKMKDAGVNVTLGTDGAASNNRLSILREMQFAALIHKGNDLDPSVTLASDMIRIATKNGAVAQGRENAGEIKVGNAADLILVDLSGFNNIPYYSLESTVCYSMTEENILMTLSDGNILYNRGAYTTIDEERLKSEARRVIAHYFD
jgi:5-methylthioadenosine/S-adenosylhomocysteine deaminase